MLRLALSTLTTEMLQRATQVVHIEVNNYRTTMSYATIKTLLGGTKRYLIQNYMTIFVV